MDFIPRKKDFNKEESSENIYESFEKLEEHNQEPINQDIQNEEYHFQEKEYKTNSLEENTKVTKSSAASRAILIGFYVLVLVIGLMAFLMIRSNKYEFYVKQDEVLIDSGSSYQIELIPKDVRYFDYLNYNYSIADESIASVDEFGTVTAKKAGTTTLKISLSPGFTSKTVKIISESIGVDSLEIKVYKDNKLQNADVLEMLANQSLTLKSIVNNREDLNVTAIYASSDPSVASVDEFGNVTAKKAGTAAISAEANGIVSIITVNVIGNSKPSDEPVETTTPTPNNNNKNTPTPTATSKVTPKPSQKVTKVDIGISSQIEKYVGQALQLSATVEPSSITGYSVKWTSSNTSVATVNKGLVTCISAGTTVITAEVDGVKTSSTIVVKNKSGNTATPTPTGESNETPPSGTQFTSSAIALNKTSLTIEKGKTQTFTLTVTKATGSVKITSSDTSIAKVTLPAGDPDLPSCNQTNNTCFLDGLTGSDALTFTVSGVAKGTAYINVVIDDIQTSDEKSVTGTGKVGILVK